MSCAGHQPNWSLGSLGMPGCFPLHPCPFGWDAAPTFSWRVQACHPKYSSNVTCSERPLLVTLCKAVLSPYWMNPLCFPDGLITVWNLLARGLCTYSHLFTATRIWASWEQESCLFCHPSDPSVVLLCLYSFRMNVQKSVQKVSFMPWKERVAFSQSKH